MAVEVSQTQYRTATATIVLLQPTNTNSVCGLKKQQLNSEELTFVTCLFPTVEAVQCEKLKCNPLTLDRSKVLPVPIAINGYEPLRTTHKLIIIWLHEVVIMVNNQIVPTTKLYQPQ